MIHKKRQLSDREKWELVYLHLPKDITKYYIDPTLYYWVHKEKMEPTLQEIHFYSREGLGLRLRYKPFWLDQLGNMEMNLSPHTVKEKERLWNWIRSHPNEEPNYELLHVKPRVYLFRVQT